MLTLARVAAEPSSASSVLSLADGRQLMFRPLAAGDEAALANFLAGLSAVSRRFSSVWDDVAAQAASHVEAIARYDKLRLVLAAGRPDGRPAIIGLLEFSLDLVTDDVERFATYGVALGRADARFGLCVADGFHGTGVAAAATAAAFEVVRRFGRQRVILWGGVLDENLRARAFYRRIGFVELGTWRNDDGDLVHDGLFEL